MSIQRICHRFGQSPQALYKRRKARLTDLRQEAIVLELVREKRKELAREGYAKLYRRMKAELDRMGLKVGRDKLLKMLRDNNLLVKPKKSFVKTTNSFHHYRVYENLIKEHQVTRSNEVYVSDITYIRLKGKKFMYLALITDLYSRKIVGYDFSGSLELEGCLRAMKMALRQRRSNSGKLIHHSDRGIQYCSKVYTGLLKKHEVEISMAAKGDCYENATAERVNGILKDEFMLDQYFSTPNQARKAVRQAIEKYNNVRLHMGINYMTPKQKHAA